MRRIATAAVLALVLGGCDEALVSKMPLIEQGKTILKPGLWAILPADCTTPTDSHVFDWEPCAKPARVRNGELSVFSSAGPVKLALVASDGMPVILQVSADKARIEGGASDLYSGASIDLPPTQAADAKVEPLYSYLAFLPDPGAPVTKGMLMPLYCPDHDEPDIKRPSDKENAPKECEVSSAKAIRRVAQETVSTWPRWQAIWIADEPYGAARGPNAVAGIPDVPAK